MELDGWLVMRQLHSTLFYTGQLYWCIYYILKCL